MLPTEDFALPEGLGPLEREIKDDFDGSVARGLIERLDAAARDAADPHVPNGYELARGYMAAQRIVRTVWQQMHSRVLAA